MATSKALLREEVSRVSNVLAAPHAAVRPVGHTLPDHSGSDGRGMDNPELVSEVSNASRLPGAFAYGYGDRYRSHPRLQRASCPEHTQSLRRGASEGRPRTALLAIAEHSRWGRL